MAIREKKPTDVADIFQCCSLIYETLRNNSGIHGTLWTSAMARIIAEVYANSGCSHDEYCEEMKKVSEYYKCLWENK